MNGELPLIAVGGSGAALLAGIHLRERRADDAMRSSRIRLALTFPAGVDALQAKSALSAIAGIDRGQECVFSVEAAAAGIRHFVYVPAAIRHTVVSSLTGAMPGLRVADAPMPTGWVTLAAKLHFPVPLVMSTDQPDAAVRTLLAGVAGLASGEHAILRVAVRPGRPRAWSPQEPPDLAAREAERLWRQKVGSGAGVDAAGLVLVRAASLSRARELCEHLTSCLRSRRGPVGTLRITTERGSRNLAALPKTTRSSGWLTAAELLGSVLGWPLGETPVPGVEVGAARELPVPGYVPEEGYQLLTGRDSRGNPRRATLSQDAMRLHLALLGGTGSGKTTVLIRLILDALARGVGGVHIEPKDGLPTLLDHVPPEHADRVVVLDPAQPGPVPGLDLFGSGEPSLRSDVILSVLRGVSEGWGSRIDRFLRTGLRSLAVLPDPLLADWLRLYNDPVFRRSVASRVSDPVIAAEWGAFEGLSPAEQHSYVAPAMARITDLLSRPALRAVLSQPDPRLNIGRLLDEGKWLVVDLSPGTLGAPAARLLGAVVAFLFLAAVEARATLPEPARRPVMLVADELQSLSDLPVGLEVFFERLRSFNCGVVVATQAAARLPEATRQALFANVGSLMVFRSGGEEAARLSRELPPLTASDLMALGRYEIAARISTAGRGRGSVVVTGHTEPLPPATGQAQHIRALSAKRYGCDPRVVDDALRRRSATDNDAPSPGSFGRTGRPS